MSTEGGDACEAQHHVEDDVPPKKELSENGNSGSCENLAQENGTHDDDDLAEDSHGQLLQLVAELRFQNVYLKSELEGLKISHIQLETKAGGKDGEESEGVKELRDKIENLNRELLEEKQTRGAAEEALKHLREEYTGADAKAQELSAKLTEGEIRS